MQYRKWAFTFVELIVVLTIVAILATIGFTVYESYLSSGRDTNRIVQLKDIHWGLTVYATKSNLPTPDNAISITTWSNVLLYQGDISETIIKTIKYNGWGKDTDLNIFPTYSVAANKKDFQLLWFVEDAETLLLQTNSQWYADVDYTTLFPKVIGSPLWVMLDASTQEPLQSSDTLHTSPGTFDILTGTGELRVYYSDREFFDTSWGDILDIIPNRHCKRIMEIWNSRWNWEYNIIPDGVNRERVYCDMELDGWWWTLIARSADGSPTAGFWWIYETWSIKDDTQAYSYGSWSRFLDFDQISLASYEVWKKISFAAYYNVDSSYYLDNYDLQGSPADSDAFISPMNTCTLLIPHPTDTTPTHCTTYEKDNWGKFAYEWYVLSRNVSDENGLRADGTVFHFNDEYSNNQAMIFVR